MYYWDNRISEAIIMIVRGHGEIERIIPVTFDSKEPFNNLGKVFNETVYLPSPFYHYLVERGLIYNAYINQSFYGWARIGGER